MSLEKWKLNSDKTAAVATGHHWLPIDDKTPLGVRVLAIRKSQGIAQVTMLRPSNLIWYDWWFPLPRFPD